MLSPRAPHCLNLRSAQPSPPHLQSHALVADAGLDAAGGDAARLTVGTLRKGSGEVWAGSQLHLLPYRRVLLVRHRICASPAYCPHLTCPRRRSIPSAQTHAPGLPPRVRFACLLPAPLTWPRACTLTCPDVLRHLHAHVAHKPRLLLSLQQPHLLFPASEQVDASVGVRRWLR